MPYAPLNRPRQPLTMLALAALLGCSDATAPSERPGRPDSGTGDWTAVGVGGETACALDRSGRAYCWGYNSSNALGTTNSALRETAPTPVAGAPAAFRSLATGYAHTCALSAESRAFCWGWNEYGQLGVGFAATIDVGRYVTVPTPVAGDLTFRALSAGLGHTCGLTDDGTAYCWGDHHRKQLGAGGSVVCDPASEPMCGVASPVRVAGGMRFAQISAGRWHTCAVTADATGYCWGDNMYGQLGNPEIPIRCGAGAIEPCVRDEPIAVGGGHRFAQISAGAGHTCGVTTDGKAYCWGLATGDIGIGAAELGNAAYSGYHSAERGSRFPVPVEGGLTFRAVSAGNRVSCGQTVDSRAVCWGSNNFGQMGIGGAKPDFSTTPREVWMPAVAKTPAVGEEDNICALTTTGRIFCWGGYNFYGEIGSNPVSERSDIERWFLRGTPTAVDAPAEH
jgi:alpha-tubulin suppressor-like RCC1 family protein